MLSPVSFLAGLLLVHTATAAPPVVADPNTGLQWRLVPFAAAGPTSDKVQSVYTQGFRPARYSEFTAFLATYAGREASLVTAFGGAESTGTLYNATAGKWLTASLAANPAPSVNFNSTVSVAASVFAVTQLCNTTNSVGVNIVDVYPDFTISADNVVDACLCNSQYSGQTCSKYTQAVGCSATTTGTDAYTGQQTLYGGSINGMTDSVIFNISSPAVYQRNITGFSWGKCRSDATTGGGLTGFQVMTNPSSCDDTYVFSYRVADLVSLCGLNKAIDADGANDTVRYRGDLIINYLEWAPLGTNNEVLKRTGRLVTPIDVYIERKYDAELDVKSNTTIFVYSPFEIQAAIVATKVKANSTTTYMDIAIAINSPYAIVQIDGGNSLPHKSDSAGVPDIAWACILQNTDSTTPSCTAKATWLNRSGLGDCVKSA